MEKLISFINTFYENYNNLIKEERPSEAFRQLSYVRGMKDALFIIEGIECKEDFGGIDEDPLLSFETDLISKITFYKGNEIIKTKEFL